MKNCFFDYDAENDNFFAHFTHPKTKGCIEIRRGIFLDLDAERYLVGIELWDASKVLSDLTKARITPALLRQIRSCDLDEVPREDAATVRLSLRLSDGKKIVAAVLVPPAQCEPAVAYA